MRIILGGGAGLCGSWLSRELLDKGHEVTIIDNLSESYIENIDRRAAFYQFNCADYEAACRVFEAVKPDYVYSMQANAAEILSQFSPLNNYFNTLISVVSFSNACIKYEVKKHIAFSSIAAYGHQNPPFSEETPLFPSDPYAISKMALEHHARVCKEQYDLNYSVVRPHNFQGPFVNLWSKYRNFIGIAVREALQDKPIPVFNDGSQTRQFSHIKYLCDPLEKLLTTECQTVNVGADISYKIIDVAEIIKKIANKDSKNNVAIQYLPKRFEAQHVACDHKLAKNVLGFEDRTDIEELCYDVYHWAKTQPNREVKKAEYEITKGLPPSWE